MLRSDGQLVRLREDGDDMTPPLLSHEPWGTHIWPSVIGYRQDLPADSGVRQGGAWGEHDLENG